MTTVYALFKDPHGRYLELPGVLPHCKTVVRMQGEEIMARIVCKARLTGQLYWDEVPLVVSSAVTLKSHFELGSIGSW